MTEHSARRKGWKSIRRSKSSIGSIRRSARNSDFRFPIELTQEELRDGAGRQVRDPRHLSGRAATRRCRSRKRPDEQSYFEAGEGENPLDVADGLGRPMAILRIGRATARAADPPDETFLYGSPPMLMWKPNQRPCPAADSTQSVAKSPYKIERAAASAPIRRTR